MLSVYVSVSPDPGELKGVHAQLESLLAPLRDLEASRELGHYERESVRADIDRLLAVADERRALQGRALALFACSRAGLFERIELNRPVGNRVMVDSTPHVRPLLGVLDASHRYCVLVVDRANAWVYEFASRELVDTAKLTDKKLRSPNFAGALGIEKKVHSKAELLARKHFHRTVDLVHNLMTQFGAEMLFVGGHEETVAEFLDFLPHDLRPRVAGTFVIDPHTMTQARAREAVEAAVDAYEHEEEARLVSDALERVAERGLGAAGLDWCLMAVNERAVDTLLVDESAQVPGRVSDDCGWLGLDGDECPVCGKPTREVADVLDEMAVAVIDASGRVESVSDARLAPLSVAALVRFPVPRPS